MLIRRKNSPTVVRATSSPSRPISSVKEAQSLVRRCTEPSQPGETVKGAIRRAAQRLQLPFSRVRDIWYGDARRIDALEMDRMRRVADEAELAQAVSAVEFTLKRLEYSRDPSSSEVIVGLKMALDALIPSDRGGSTSLVSDVTYGSKSVR